MTPEQWQKVEELLNAALEIEPIKRREFLDRIGAGELRSEVESLLEAEKKADKFLTFKAIEFAPDLFDTIEEPDALAGQKIGNYRIVRELGHGGMGAVFLAERSDGAFEQLVALKIVRQTILDAETERRFRQERQILASLNHPNIARLLDGGISASGEPFLVMEYVEGTRIDCFCRAENLSIRERLKLFLAVCGAVSYAHQNLVVHRDIKPSNILVTKDGAVKLLDFGIAKLIGGEHGDDLTQTNYRAFTPEYASPEQIAGEPITTASDVYSLGVLLDELFRDKHYFKEEPPLGKWRTKEPRDSETKTIVTNIPTKQDESKKLANAELKNIAAFARREDPKRRYASVTLFAEDVQRYLEGLPVRAQRDSFTYRTGKFVKRNRLPVAAAALVVLSLFAGLTVAAWQASVAREKAIAAEENQKRAEAASNKQKKITGFMEKVLSYASPAWYAEGNRFKEPARVIDVLIDLSQKIETEFPNDTDIQAELHHKCAEIFLANRMTDRAEIHARRALRLRRQVFGEKHADVAKDLYYLGEVLGTLGNYLEKEKLLVQAALIFREIAPDNANLPYLLESLGDLKTLAHGDFDAAENLFAESLALFRQRDGEDHFNTARLYLQLSAAVAGKGDQTRAEKLFREGEYRAAQMRDAELRLVTLGFRGRIELIKGNNTAAEAVFKQLLDETEKVKNASDGTGINVRNALLEIYQRENNWTKSVAVQQEKIGILKNQMPETSFAFGKELAELSVYLFRTGKIDEAARHFEKANQIFQTNKSNAAISDDFHIYIGECLMLQNRRDEALPLLEKIGELYSTNYPPQFHLRIRVEKLIEQARAIKSNSDQGLKARFD